MEVLEQESREENLSLEEKFTVEARALYNELIKEPEIVEALTLLDKLPEHLLYHAKAHTPDVIFETILFALADGASREVIKQQAIAAAWHDTGFVESEKNNELIAIRLFGESEGYKNMPLKDKEETAANIFDTQVVMEDAEPFLLKRRSKLGYALDGDVSNFGRKDFFEKSKMVAEEMGLDLNNPEIKKKFYKLAIGLLKNHNWKTASAKAMRQTQKEENLRLALKEYENIQ